MAVLVQLDTRALPPVTFDSSAPSSAPGLGARLVRWLQPRVRVYVDRWNVADVAPYGAPAGTSWPALAVAVGLVVLAVLVLAGIGLVSVLRRRRGA